MTQAAMAELPPEQREVITLKIWGEMTFAEIGEDAGHPAEYRGIALSVRSCPNCAS